MSGPWAEDGRLTPLSAADRERLAEHERRIANALARRAGGGDSMPTGPAGDDDWLSKDDPPPRKPEPKPEPK